MLIFSIFHEFLLSDHTRVCQYPVSMIIDIGDETSKYHDDF